MRMSMKLGEQSVVLVLVLVVMIVVGGTKVPNKYETGRYARIEENSSGSSSMVVVVVVVVVVSSSISK